MCYFHEEEGIVLKYAFVLFNDLIGVGIDFREVVDAIHLKLYETLVPILLEFLHPLSDHVDDL